MLNIRMIIRRRRRPSGTNLVSIVIIILKRVLNRCLVLVYNILMIYLLSEFFIHYDDYTDSNGSIMLKKVFPQNMFDFFLYKL